MTALKQFLQQLASPTLQHVEDARALQEAMQRFSLVLEAARKASEEIKARRIA